MKIFIFTIILIFYNNYVYSSNLFETKFYSIEFTSKNIEDDKIKEVIKIKNKSLLSIFKKTLNQDNYNLLNKFVSEDLINYFIKNIVIDDEKIINNQYKSKIKINFDKKKIIDYYRQKRVSYVEFYPDKFLLIIFEEDKISENLFTNNNIFYKYYTENYQNNNLFKIPNIDINDNFILSKKHINKRDLEKINNFSSKYNLNDTIIVIVSNNDSKISYDLILNSGGVILEKKLNYDEFQLENFFKILEKETLIIWKNINQIQNNSLSFLNCKINYFNMLELKAIKSSLDNVSIIKDLNIKSISYKNIEYEITFFGNLQILLEILKLNSLNLDIQKDSCVIKLI